MNGFRNRLTSCLSFTIFICISLLVLVPGCSKKETGVIKIGAILPLTGDGALFGNSIQRGMDLAVDEINENIGSNGNLIKILYEDSQGLVQIGISGLRKLIELHKVPVVMGAVYSSITLACAPIANESKTVLISPISSNYKIKDAGDYVFRIWPSDALQGIELAQLAINLGYQTAGVIYIHTDYGVGLDMSFSQEFQNLGGQVIFSEAVALGETDMKAQLAKAKVFAPDVIFSPIHPKEGGILLKQAVELGLSMNFLMGDGFNEPSGIEIAGTAAEGIIVPSLAKGRDEVYQPFYERYKAKYGNEPSDNAAAGYDLVNIVYEIINQNGYEGDAIKAGLYEMKGFDGVTGITSFDDDGEVAKDYAFLIIRDGRFEPYVPTSK